jgi:hypothetical protein
MKNANNININSIVQSLEALLKSEYGKCELVDGTWRSGDEAYHLYRISGNESDGAITIARNYMNGRYMAQFSCVEGNLDIFFAFGAKQRSTIRWRYYFDPDQDKYTQGNLDDWFLVESASKTMSVLIAGTGVREDEHEGHCFYELSSK